MGATLDNIISKHVTNNFLVYHHCLFGTRYDFLCANYTAFDQTLFNCNFVSKVDCINSKDFWSRNDELYKTKATPPPPVAYNFYTQAPPTYPAVGSPSRRNPLFGRIPPPNVNHPIPVEMGGGQQLPSTMLVQGGIESPTAISMGNVPQLPAAGTVPLAPRRRPLMRPRPYYDYYDDYDEPQYYRRKRPRPRPYYDDEYEYYDDDRYDRRVEARRRRPMRRYQGRRDKYEDEEELYEDDDRYVDEEEPRRRKGNRGGTMAGSRNKPSRQPPRRKHSEKVNKKQPDYYYDDEYDDKPMHRKPQSETNKNRKPTRKPSYEYEDDEDVDYRKNRRGGATETSSESKMIIKPTSGTIFDRPRVAPKINLPVPKNVADKYSYKAMSPKTKEIIDYDDDEYDELPATNKSTEKLTIPETNDGITTMRGNFKFMTKRPMPNSNEAKSATSSPNRKMKPAPLDDEDDEIQEGKANIRQTTVRVKSPVSEEVQKDAKRPQNKERRGYLSRINMFKTRHSLSTPEINRDLEVPDDFAEIDDSINEA